MSEQKPIPQFRPVEPMSRTPFAPPIRCGEVKRAGGPRPTVRLLPYAGPCSEEGLDSFNPRLQFVLLTGKSPLPYLPQSATPEGHDAIPPGINPTKPTAMTPVDHGHPTPRCKHEREDCDACGTTARRDAVHTTRGGRGVVGALRGRR